MARRRTYGAWLSSPWQVLKEGWSSLSYRKPTITDFGSIADHTFDTPGPPGKGDKGVCGNDPMFSEPSCSDEENGFS